MKKRIAAAALAVISVFGISGLPVADLGGSGNYISASAESTYGDFGYKTLSDGTIELTSYNGTSSSVTIPQTINGKKVTSLGDGLFALDNISMLCTLRSVTIPNGVTNIGEKCFWRNTQLNTISIPSSVTSIGAFAFNVTGWLNAKTDVNPLVVVNNIVIEGMECEGALTIPDGVKKIADYAIGEAEELTSVSIPASVTEIGEGNFSGCPKLKTISVSTSNSNYASSGGVLYNKAKTKLIACPSGITTLTVPKSVTSIADGAIDSEYMKKISCYTDSAAHKYAKQNGITYVLLDKVSAVTAKTTFTSATNAVRINWNKASNVDGYIIERYNSTAKKWVRLTKTTDATATSCRISGLKAGTVYKFRIKAYRGSVSGDYSATITTATNPSKVTITNVTKKSNTVTLKWKKIACSGYKLQKYNATKKKWGDVKKLSSDVTSCKLTGLKTNTTYKLRIVAYKNGGTRYTYSTPSEVKTVKISG